MKELIRVYIKYRQALKVLKLAKQNLKESIYILKIKQTLVEGII